jgi:hypothetical protein
MNKFEMFDNYEKRFWSLIVFSMMLGLGILIAYAGLLMGLSFVLGIVYTYALLKWNDCDANENSE